MSGRPSCRRAIASASSGAAGRMSTLSRAGAGREPERRDRVGDDDPLDRRVGKHLGGAGHEQAVRRPAR